MVGIRYTEQWLRDWLYSAMGERSGICRDSREKWDILSEGSGRYEYTKKCGI